MPSMEKKRKIKPISYTRAKDEAEKVFENFCTRGGHIDNQSRNKSSASEKERGDSAWKTGEKCKKKGLLKKLRSKVSVVGESFKKNKLNISAGKTENKENDEKCFDKVDDKFRTGTPINSNNKPVGNRRYGGSHAQSSSMSAHVGSRSSTLPRLSMPHQPYKFPPHIFPPPPPPPPPQAVSFPMYLDDDIQFDSPGRSRELAGNESDDDIDGEFFEELDANEQKRKIEDVASRLDRISEEVLLRGGVDSLTRSSSTSSLASMTQRLTQDLSYLSFKGYLNDAIKKQNDKLLNQIALTFTLARSALNFFSENVDAQRRVRDNLSKYYGEQFTQRVSEVGGLGSLLEDSVAD